VQSMTPGHARRIRGKLGVRASGAGRSGRLTNVNCYRRLASPMSYAGNERRGPSGEACLKPLLRSRRSRLDVLKYHDQVGEPL
jgi:hypothetical protein